MPHAQAFLREAADELGKKVPRIPAELEAMLNLYDFPGNVRELHSLVFDALSRSGGTVLNLTPFRDLVGTEFSLKSGIKNVRRSPGIMRVWCSYSGTSPR
jgi:transcriptional regulator of aromatic amino acid metabolism